MSRTEEYKYSRKMKLYVFPPLKSHLEKKRVIIYSTRADDIKHRAHMLHFFIFFYIETNYFHLP